MLEWIKDRIADIEDYIAERKRLNIARMEIRGEYEEESANMLLKSLELKTDINNAKTALIKAKGGK